MQMQIVRKSIQNSKQRKWLKIIANVASSQYGGCSADRIDEVLAPFAQLNYEKNLKTAREWIDGEDKQEKSPQKKLKKDIYDAMQSLEYEINTFIFISRTNAIYIIRFWTG